MNLGLKKGIENNLALNRYNRQFAKSCHMALSIRINVLVKSKYLRTECNTTGPLLAFHVM